MNDLKIRKVIAADLDNLKTVIDSSELFPSEMLDDKWFSSWQGRKHLADRRQR